MPISLFAEKEDGGKASPPAVIDAVDEMNRMQQLESARKEQEALSGKTDEVMLSKKHFRAG